MKKIITLLILTMAAGMFATAMPLYGATMTYNYDAAGRLTNIDYGEGATIAYTYDPSGSLLQKVITANVTLMDAISTVQLLSGANPVKPIFWGDDVSGDSRVGLEEATNLLQNLSRDDQ